MLFLWPNYLDGLGVSQVHQDPGLLDSESHRDGGARTCCMAQAQMARGCHGAGRRMDIDPISRGRDLEIAKVETSLCIFMSPSRDWSRAFMS